MTDSATALAYYVRQEAGMLVASLTRQLGNFDLAEESVQDAILEALAHWPGSGIPRQPGAWLRVTARRKAADRLRKAARQQNRLQLLATLDETTNGAASQLVDDRLVLMFMCCHPTLSREAQVALTLRSLLGVTTAQLAKAFLTAEPTMTKRIVRAKRKIVEANIPFAAPSGAEAKRRLGEVLTSIYVMFNEGYLSAGPEESQRIDLAADAEWLAGLLLELSPDEPEVMGLLALIRLHQARRPARFDDRGELVLLQNQDRSHWDRPGIDDALALLNKALRSGPPGFYTLQAAIAGSHAVARRWEDTDWNLIVGLYDQLLAIANSPIAALNRAIAIQYVQGAAAALGEIDAVEDHLSTYHLFHAARAQMLRTLGRTEEAIDAEQKAVSLTSNPAELRLLRQRLDESNLIA